MPYPILKRTWQNVKVSQASTLKENTLYTLVLLLKKM